MRREAYRVQAPEWVLRDEATRIERTYRFRSFGDAFSFVRGAGELAERNSIIRDISFGWGYATVSLRTKKIKGLHENDFIMAVKLDRLAGEIAIADKQAERYSGSPVSAARCELSEGKKARSAPRVDTGGQRASDASSTCGLAGGGCAKLTDGWVRRVLSRQYSNAPLPAL